MLIADVFALGSPDRGRRCQRAGRRDSGAGPPQRWLPRRRRRSGRPGPGRAEPGDLVVCLGAGSITAGPTPCPNSWLPETRPSNAAVAIGTGQDDPQALIDARPRSGALQARHPVGPLTWFRVGGAAQVFFGEDPDDLAHFLRDRPRDVPVSILGVGSNSLIRDGGVPGVVIV